MQAATLPLSTSAVQASPSLQLFGQFAGGSQVSPDSTTPFPQLGEQSVSVREVHPAGQHPSPPRHIVTSEWLQAAEQLAALPVMTSVVH